MSVRLTPLILLLVAVVAVGQETKKDKPDPAKAELAKLRGAWDVEGYVVSGEPLPPESIKGLQVVFKDDKMTLGTPGQKDQREFSVKLDATTKPKSLELTLVGGPLKGKVSPAIYQVEGDTLKICMAMAGPKERPTEFMSKLGWNLLTLKRAKK